MIKQWGQLPANSVALSSPPSTSTTALCTFNLVRRQGEKGDKQEPLLKPYSAIAIEVEHRKGLGKGIRLQQGAAQGMSSGTDARSSEALPATPRPATSLDGTPEAGSPHRLPDRMMSESRGGKSGTTLLKTSSAVIHAARVSGSRCWTGLCVGMKIASGYYFLVPASHGQLV